MINEKVKLLLVEDDDSLRFIVKDNLEENGYWVEIAENGAIAIELFNSNKYNLIILDVMLPKVDGFQVAQYIRKIDEKIPIIFLTARSMTEDKIKGLSLGGDDYIPKPFSMEELLLKIKIFLKRSHGYGPESSHASPTKKIGRFLFIPEELTLSYEGTTRRLTMKETELIGLFFDHKNKVLSRNEILEKVWGSNDYFLGRSLDVFISRLRKYFKPDPGIQIVNLHGIGFRFSIQNREKL